MAKGNKKSPANANGNAQQLRCMFESPVKQSLSQSPEDARRFLYARKQNASRVFAIVWASVCPSVRLSVRPSHSWAVSKRCKPGSRNLHRGLPQGLYSLSWQNFVPLGAGVPLERGRQRGVPPLKDIILPLLARIMWKRLQIGTYMLLIITSTGTWQAFWIYQHQWPWTTEVFSKFFAIFGCSAHFNTELRRNGWR